MPHLPSKPHVVSTLHPSHHASTWQLPSRVTRLLHDCLLSIIWSLGILVLAVNVILLSIIDASTCPTSNAAIPLCHLAPITTTLSETNSKESTDSWPCVSSHHPCGLIASRMEEHTQSHKWISAWTAELFVAPRAFNGPMRDCQLSALQSWLHLGPAIHIVLVGQHPSLHDVAAEHPQRVHVEDRVAVR